MKEAMSTLFNSDGLLLHSTVDSQEKILVLILRGLNLYNLNLSGKLINILTITRDNFESQRTNRTRILIKLRHSENEQLNTQRQKLSPSTSHIMVIPTHCIHRCPPFPIPHTIPKHYHIHPSRYNSRQYGWDEQECCSGLNCEGGAYHINKSY